MRITKISWKNFRPFNTEMQLGERDQVVLVNWVNGTGKTSFLNSIAWCLTGREIFTSDRYMPNGQAVKDSFASGKPLEVSVEIVFEDQTGLSTVVTRSQEFRAKSLDSVIPVAEPNVEVLREEGKTGYAKLGVTESLQWLQENFPPTLIDNFLVNGQKWGSDRKAKKGAVEAIARIDAFTRVIEHLNTVERELRNDAKPEASASEQKQKVADAEKAAQEELSRFDENVKAAQEAIDDFERENGPIAQWWDNVTRGSELKTQVDGYRRESQSAGEDITEIRRSIAQSLSVAVPSALLSEQITKLLGLLNEDSSRKAPGWLVDEVLRSRTCICGRTVDGHEEAFAELAKHSEDSGLADFFSLDSKIVDATRVMGLVAAGTLKEQLKNLRTASERKSAADGELKKLTSHHSLTEIQSAPSAESAAAIFLKLQGYQLMLEKAPEKRDELDKRVRELRAQLESDDEGLSPKAKKARDLAAFARSCIDAAEKIRTETIQGVRKKVAEEFERIFRSVSKDNEASWKSFELDEHFDIKIMDHDGQDRRAGFSAGKELSLAFSFALALGKIAGYELPLIADTPFGPMSKDVKVATVGGIRNEIGVGGASELRQMFLLMTDEEFSEKVQDAFDELHPTVFLGKYDDDSQQTEISKAELS